VSLNGTYRGFGPTDESGMAMGELELTISDNTINYRFATGLEIQTDDEGMPRSELRQLTPDEVTELFETDTNTDDIIGYMLGEDGAVLLFFPETDEMPKAPRVSVLRFFSAEIDSIFFPVMLFTPQQVAAGDFEELLRHLEAEQGDPGVIPRLSNDGKRIDPPS